MKKYLIIICLCSIVIASVQSCKDDKEDDPIPAPTTDEQLFTEISTLTGYTYYVGTPDITAALGGSPHGFERVRFNAIAQAALDGTGKLPVGGTFPEGSVIVKNIYASATGPLTMMAVMKKASTNSSSGSNYLWAEFKLNGENVYSSALQGAGCVSCHSAPDNRDLVRTFDLH